MASDGLARLAIAVFLAIVVAKVVIVWRGYSSLPFGFGFTILTFIALVKDQRKLVRTRERRFWATVTVAWGCAVAEGLINFLQTRHFIDIHGLFGTVAIVAFYVLWAGAVESEPHRPQQRSLTGFDRLLTWPAVTIFVAGVTIYFLAIPVLQNQAYTGMLYVVLDTYVSLRLLWLANNATSPRWQQLYLGLGVCWAAQALASGVGVFFPGLPSLGLELPSILTYLLFALAARLRHRPLAGPVETVAVPHHVQDDAFLRSVHTLAFGLAFPVGHYVVYRLGFFNEFGNLFQPMHEAIVLTGLATCSAVAFIQHRILEMRAQMLWNERQGFEQALRESEEDLRLMVARGRAAEAERQAQEKFDHAFRACPYAVVISRYEDGKLVEVNPAFERILGFRRDEVIGRVPQELGLWESDSEQQRFQQQLDATSTLREHRTHLRRKNGETCVVLFSAEILDIEGRRSLLAIFRELDAEARAVEELRQEGELLDQASAAIFLLDAEGRVRYANAATARLLDASEEDLLGQPVTALFGAGNSFWREAEEGLVRQAAWKGTLRPESSNGRTAAWTAWGSRLENGQLWVLSPNAENR